MRRDDTLLVRVASEHVATLRRTRGGLALDYEPTVIATHGLGAVCLSMSLPVTNKRIEGPRVERWAEGLLPEGEARTVLEDQFAVRRGDVLGLLRAVGRDCAGAVTFHTGDADSREAALAPMSRDELEHRIADLPLHPLGADDDVPVSLAGLQHKLLLVRTDSGWARPLHGYPSTHILKPDPFALPGLIASEAFVMTAARLAGLDVAEVELDQFAGRDVLVVRRFDRKLTDGGLQRLHQEDGCQALGIDPSRDNKYERPGHRDNPSYGRFAQLLLDHAIDPRSEQAKLAEAMVLHIVSGNTDAHARNHAFLIDRGTVRLAPVYDAAPTIEFSNTTRCALRICGQDMIERVTRQHLQLEASAWVPLGDDARSIVVETAAKLEAAFVEAAAALPQVPTSIVERLCVRAARLAD